MLIWLKKVEHYKKVGNHKLGKNIKFFESILKNGKKSYNIW